MGCGEGACSIELVERAPPVRGRKRLLHSPYPPFLVGVGVFALCLACRSTETAGKTEDGEREGEVMQLPGAQPYDDDLRERIRSELDERGAGYVPRTRHRADSGEALYTNRLIFEPSPYLQQHAHNPVNWYPWGDEAFEAAKRLGRPVFLSIGYSTCHWCHVMEEESFEDEEVARFLNEHYVAIKVDREERPDVDSLYMNALLAMGMDGGWPLNLWLTADRKPFFGGTYFPPEKGPSRGRPGFLSVLKKLEEAHEGDRARIASNAERVAELVARMSDSTKTAPSAPGTEVLEKAMRQLSGAFDSRYGGLRAPRRGNKFPSSLPIRFLLRYHRRTGASRPLQMAELTLDRMAAGGLYDQVGGGFHRYSTDPRWLVPHFEKMLYDNALLAVTYLEAFQLTGKERYLRIVREVLDYVRREMRSPEGGFYSASDADSASPDGERLEGYFFTWTLSEVQEVLGADLAPLATDYFGLSESGDFEGRNVLHLRWSLEELAEKHGLDRASAEAKISEIRERLYKARAEREAPALDDKTLVAWNGLMISAFARAARVCAAEREAYLGVAIEATRFLLENLREDGRLLRSYRGGQAHLRAYLEDYAFFTAALLDLFEATAEVRWLDHAIALERDAARLYGDPRGGFFTTASDHQGLFAREKSARDGAIPSGNSAAALNAFRLYQLTGDARYRERGESVLRAFSEGLAQEPTSLSEMLLALDFMSDDTMQIVLVEAEQGDADPLERKLSERFVPNHVFVRVRQGAHQQALAAKVPLVAGKAAIDERATAYVCRAEHCELPTADPDVFVEQISRVAPLDDGSASPDP